MGTVRLHGALEQTARDEDRIGDMQSFVFVRLAQIDDQPGLPVVHGLDQILGRDLPDLSPRLGHEIGQGLPGDARSAFRVHHQIASSRPSRVYSGGEQVVPRHR